MNAYKTSQAGIDAIKNFEGFRATAYEDVVGKKTIGYGHLILPSESLEEITKDQAEFILKLDLSAAEKAVSEMALQPLAQNEFDALVSFTFNLGRNALRNSTLLRLLNAGNFEGAADQFLRWDHAGGLRVKGLTKRRIEERRIFLDGHES